MSNNFSTRCIATLAGNGAILATLSNFLASHDHLLNPQRVAAIGGISAVSLIGVTLAFLALGREETNPKLAARLLKYSAATFLLLLISYIGALESESLSSMLKPGVAQVPHPNTPIH